ncbi:MAG: M56 family metallopeptidase [Acidobacteria bacterium]|nr:M56 family metallopeptidase [Acidobacteriota bacterium]
MIDELARHWFAAILDVSVQFTVLAGLMAVALLLMRRLAPGIRHLVWLLVLLRLAMPVGLASPLGTVPASWAEPRTPGGAARYVRDAGERGEASTLVATSGSSGNATSDARDRLSAASSGGFAVSPVVVVFVAWGAGVLLLTVVQVLRAARRRAQTRAVIALSPEVGRRVDRLRRELGLHGAVDAVVVADDAVAGPVVEGCLRPRILLPASLVRGWTAEELDPILLHELVHLQRRDPAVRALANLLQIVYFFHPVVWWVGRRLDEAREQACDDAVVRHVRGAKRAYIGALLRLVEERSVVQGAAGLGMVRSRRPLALRVKRMLRRRYDPAPRAGVLSMASLICCLACALALSTEARMPQPVEFADTPRIQVRPSWSAAFLTDSVAEVDRADRVPVGGDFTIGRATTPLLPDVEALAAADPALVERLDARGRLTATLIVDQDGAVRRVGFADDVDEDLRRPFLEVLDAARFDPTTHFARGPSIVEVQVDYYINPVTPPRSVYETGQLFEGDEVADVLPAMGGPAIAVRYSPVLEKGPPPVLDVGDEELILSFLVSVDARGHVDSASLFRDSRRALTEEVEASTESDRLVGYVETFRFEPVVFRDGTPTAANLMLDLRVSRRGVEVATRRGDEAELDRRLADIYGLPDGRSLDLRLPPDPPERMTLYRTHPVQARWIPGGPDMMTIVWRDGRPTAERMCFGCNRLVDLLEDLGVRRGAVRFEGGAEDTRIHADVVRRQGVAREVLLRELPQVLRERLDLDLQFRMVAEPSRTLVLRGAVGELPPDDEVGGRGVLHVFTDRRDEPGVGGGGLVSTAGMAAMLSGHLEMPVIDETNEPDAESFQLRLHDSAYQTQRLELLIRSLEAQTDLDIAVEERANEVLIVSRNPS